MNPLLQKLIITIAEFDGFQRLDTAPVNILRWIHPNCPECISGDRAHSHSIDELPDYFNDLNAINRACTRQENGKAKLRIAQYQEFLLHLKERCRESTEFSPMIFASASRRSAALAQMLDCKTDWKPLLNPTQPSPSPSA